MILPMTVDVSTIRNGDPFLADPVLFSMWISSCIHSRLSHQAPPVSLRSLLMTFACDKYNELMTIIRVDHSAQKYEIINANNAMRALLDVSIDTVSSKLAHFHDDCSIELFGYKMVNYIKIV